MKRFVLGLAVIMMALWSATTLANNVGVVNMQQIFHNAPQVKQINSSLSKQFKNRKDRLVNMGQSLQRNIKEYQKNRSVMTRSDLDKLKAKITGQELKLRQAQAKFQRDLFTAQNQKMKHFLDQVRSVVSKIAQQKHLNVVLAKNAVLYSKQNSDITSDVLSQLR